MAQDLIVMVETWTKICAAAVVLQSPPESLVCREDTVHTILLLECLLPDSHPPFPQVEKADPGVRAASEGCGEDPPERQAVPRTGVCPRGAQEANHVLHRRPRPPWPTTSPHRLWAHPTLYQVTNRIIFLAGALLLLALPLARAWPPPTPPEPRPPGPRLASQCYCWGSCCLEMYHRDERLWSLCYVASSPEIALRLRQQQGTEVTWSQGDPWPLITSDWPH